MGLRIQDILRGIDVLKGKGLLFGGECAAYAKGRTLTADLLHAAVLDKRIGALALEDSLVSYAALARSPIHQNIFDLVIPGVSAATISLIWSPPSAPPPGELAQFQIGAGQTRSSA